MNRGRQLRPAGAFTLVELLAVIAIIGVLVAIVIPLIGSTRSKARRSECSANMRSVIMGVQLYAADHQGKFPETDDPASGIRSGSGTPNPASTGLIDQLFAYVNTTKAFYCAGVPEESSYSFSSQNARTTMRFRQMGYYWLPSPLSQSAFGARPSLPQTRMGEPNRVLMTCIYNVGGAGRPHDSNLNVAFADGSVGLLGQGRSISTATVDFGTLTLRR